jgi:hypothetical protein
MQAPALPIEAVFPPPSRADRRRTDRESADRESADRESADRESAPPDADAESVAATLVSSPLPEAPPRASAVPPIPVRPSPPLPPSFTASLLAEDATPSLRREATRFGVGLGLAALYGLALGARGGGVSFLAHAAGVPAALLAAFGVGVPALSIVLALVDAPIALPAIGAATSRATATGGLVLAGLAPAAALFVVTSERGGAAALAAGVGLAVGGAFGLGTVVSDLRKAIADARPGTRLAADLALAGFGLFAIVVSLRVWASLLPVLGGAR